MRPAICNGNRSQKGKQRINGSVRVAKSVVPGGIHILAKVRISLLAPALPHPIVCTSAVQEAVALPLLPVVTSVMSPILFVGSNPSRFFSVDDSSSL
jgi:hypothetical protein